MRARIATSACARCSHRWNRLADRGAYERSVIDAILDEALTGHLAFVHDGQPYAVPTIHGRIGDTVDLEAEGVAVSPDGDNSFLLRPGQILVAPGDAGLDEVRALRGAEPGHERGKCGLASA